MKKTDSTDREQKKILERIASLEARTPEDAAQASRKISEFRNKTEVAKNTAMDYLKEIKKSLDLANQVVIDLEKEKALSSELTQSATEKTKVIDESVSILEDRKTSMLSYVEELELFFEDHADIENEIKRFEELIKLSEENYSKIEAVHKSVLTKRGEINKLHLEVFGYNQIDEETGEKTEIEGLKTELEKAYDSLKEKIGVFQKEIDDFKKTKESDYIEIQNNWSERYLALEKQIQSLLPNALTAGLSAAYSDKKGVEVIEMNKLSKRFSYGIYGLIAVSLIPFIASVISLFSGDTFDQVVFRLPRLALAILPLYVPVLWITYSANRKMNLSKRLIEEYTHKEVISRTFEGLSRQINEIDNPDVSSELRVKLLYNILEVSSENPGKLISDYSRTDHPLMDALDKSSKLSTAVEKLENIPGLRKIAKHLDTRAQKLVKEQADKIESALDVTINEIKPN